MIFFRSVLKKLLSFVIFYCQFEIIQLLSKQHKTKEFELLASEIDNLNAWRKIQDSKRIPFHIMGVMK